MSLGPDWGAIVEYRDGKLYWKVNTFSGKAKNLPATVVGKEAGTRSGKGYHTVRFQGHRCYRHVIIWMLHNGPIPIGFQVDHIKSLREGGDDSIDNLQLLTPGTNTRKGGGKMANSSNKSCSRRGVSLDGNYEAKPWRARITVDGTVHLKHFESFEEACNQREVWEKMFCGRKI